MTRKEAEDYVWQAHDTYFVQHPEAQTYSRPELYALVTHLLPTEPERQALYAALGIATCVTRLQAAGIDPTTFCAWCAVCTQVLDDDWEGEEDHNAYTTHSD